ncbi:MAG: glucoamylase family protein, partial [Acidobacteriota bacterium]
MPMPRPFAAWFRTAPQALDKPFRDELLSIEGLEERAMALAATFTVDPNPRAHAVSIFPRFHDNARVLRETYRSLADDVARGEFVAPAGEWLLDNFYLLASQIRDIQQDLPRHFYRELPVLAARDRVGQTRIYAMAVELVRHSDSRLDIRQLTVFLNSYQRVVPLAIGELWAWPSMLMLALIENLRRLAAESMAARRARLDADAYLLDLENARGSLPLPPALLQMPSIVQLLHRVREYGQLTALRASIEEHLAAENMTAEEAVRGEHQRQAVTQVSVANAITSLRLCSVMDWREYVESVSLVEQILRRDPAGVHRRMDFLSRDRQRQSVEDLAPHSGEGQVRVALRAVESAREALSRGSLTDRAAHTGYHLVGRGRRGLEADLGYRPPWTRWLRRQVFAHATFVYLTPIVAGALLLAGAAHTYLRQHGASPWWTAAVTLLCLLPATDIAIAVVQRLLAWAIPPRRLLRLDLSEGVPEEARTMVIIPTLFTSAASVAAMLEHVEVLALGNLDPYIHFAILSDFGDAPSETLPEDAALVAAARSGIERLNQHLGSSHADRFFLFHRHRQWNAREHVWMGWERKRGKIEEFNHLLRGASDTSFSVQVGALAVLPSVRYCLTLDSDTRLPRDAARQLIGVAAHPLNRPVFHEAAGRVTAGYGILQPRVSVTMASAAGSLFARTYAGHTGVDPYTTAVSDTYQDLFDEGIFTGKGLYDVDAFIAALERRVPENTLLSHDLFEGLYARTALVSDVEVVDDYPASVLAHARRQHRWVRGDWQILWWLLPLVPTRGGIGRNRLPLIARWKILDNLRRSLMAPAVLAIFLLGWAPLPGSPDVWTVVGLAAIVLPVFVRLLQLVRVPPRGQSIRVFLRTTFEDIAAECARVLLQLVFLAFHAAQMVHAIVVTLVRIGFTKHRLLEWEASTATRERTAVPLLSRFMREMMASPIIAAGGLVLVIVARPQALPDALVILALWAAAPLVAFVLSQPVPARQVVLDDTDRRLLMDVARKTWLYFEHFMTAEDYALPPDNVQVGEDVRVAHRTSPTNIGLGLLSILAAHDFQFITTDDLADRVEATLTTVERLEKYQGHLLNWYDTRTLVPLAPPYVSAVDSGNLAGALVTLAVGLVALADTQPADMPGRERGDRLRALAERCETLFAGMNFRFLYDPHRQLFSIGYRLADGDGPERLDTSYYDLLASEARLTSFLAIAKGEVPESHWFHLGRAVTSVHGAPVLLSWSASMFEYLMPLLVMRSYPETLLDESCQMAVRRQIEYATARGVPWGISESAYSVVDRHDTYQYKAFGVPGLGLKRGLHDDLVVAPYATALAAMIDPSESAANLRRLARYGADGDYGFFDAIDFTNRDPDRAGEKRITTKGVVVRTYMAHHQGMTLVALANALLDGAITSRFHADARVRATELLLQERRPRYAPTVEPRPQADSPAAAPALSMPVRRYRSADTAAPHAQFLSNGAFVSILTNAGGGSSFYRGMAVTRSRRDFTRDWGGYVVYVRDARTGAFWSATHNPTPARPDDYRVEFRTERVTFARRDGELSTRLEVAVSTEDDVEVRRVTLTNHGVRNYELDVTSYAEIVLAPPADDFAHPAFAKLFLETEYLADCAALLCHRRPRDSREPGIWAMHVLSLEGRPQGALEWETDRAQFIGRGRDLDAPAALDGRALSGTTGVVLDPL